MSFRKEIGGETLFLHKHPYRGSGGYYTLREWQLSDGLPTPHRSKEFRSSVICKNMIDGIYPPSSPYFYDHNASLTVWGGAQFDSREKPEPRGDGSMTDKSKIPRAL
jgi:hypothetical protein